MPINNLWVIMPVYNEEASLQLVVAEWIMALNHANIKYTLCILNDGSKDQTWNILQTLASKHSCIESVNKTNSGHGQTCIEGYKLALKANADWIFQIDSDGQCDPIYFKEMMNATSRDDGFKRMIVSFFVSIFTWVATGQYLRDPNVPYRLIHRTVMEKIVHQVPNDFHLANIYVSVCSNKISKIKWIPIHFRNRIGGTASVKTFSFVKHGFKLFKQLRLAQNSLS
jgi:dolichol-phosphate mannosyltransferase